MEVLALNYSQILFGKGFGNSSKPAPPKDVRKSWMKFNNFFVEKAVEVWRTGDCLLTKEIP